MMLRLKVSRMTFFRRLFPRTAMRVILSWVSGRPRFGGSGRGLVAESGGAKSVLVTIFYSCIQPHVFVVIF